MIKRAQAKFDSLLTEYSPRFGLDLNYFVKNGFWLNVSQFFNILKYFVLSIIFANFLTKNAFGEYNFIMSVLAIMSVIALPGMSNTIFKSVSEKFHGNYFLSLKKIFNYSLIGSLALIFVSAYYFFSNFILASAFLFLAVIFPIYILCPQYVNFFNGLKKFELQAKLSSFFNFISTLIIIGVVFYTNNILYILLSMILTQVLIQGYYTFFLVKKYIKNNNVDLKSVEFGKKISLSSAYSTVALRLDSLIVATLLGFEELAIYTIITVIPNQIKTMSSTFTPLFLPKLVENKNTTKKDIRRHFWRILLITSGLILVYVVCAKFIFQIFYPQYLAYWKWSALFSISILSFATTIQYAYFIKCNASKIINITTIVLSTYVMVGSFFWIYYFGIMGAIINKIIFRFLGFIFYEIGLNKLDTGKNE
ncbi:MAG: oligosaccharide flippase family protein [Candidatus Nanoarchaeia archaeon]|nr:oligosaccharide flippase family protein [Candidatus Nanoarchaeia archaeon]